MQAHEDTSQLQAYCASRMRCTALCYLHAGNPLSSMCNLPQSLRSLLFEALVTMRHSSSA